jgi:hypothetical protein
MLANSRSFQMEETQLVAVVFFVRAMTCTNIFEIAEKITEKSPQQQF